MRHLMLSPVRCALVVVVALGMLATPFFAELQPVQKTFRLAHLSAGGRTPDGAPPGALRQALRDLGYVVHDGGLMSYGPSPEDGFRRAAAYVDGIFKGAKPADLPAEQPTRYYLAVNVKAPATLGLTIPPSLLLRADEVVQ